MRSYLYTFFRRSILIAAIVLLCVSESFAAPTWGDYDGDGLADLSVSIVYRNSGSSAWLTRTGSANYLFWTFGVAGDAFVAGHYFGDNRYYPGLVRVTGANEPLEWRIKTPTNSEVALRYGLPGDTVPNQQDVDCDGITDFTVTRQGQPGYYPGFLLWYTALSGSGGMVLESVFGLADDKPGLADMDGDRCAELVVLRPGSYVWYAKKLRESNYSAVQWGLDGDIPLLPSDLNGDNIADYIVARRTGLLQQGYVRYGNGAGNFQIFNLGFDSSVPQVGNFLGIPFFTWHQRDTGWVAIGDRTRPNNIGQLHLFGVKENFVIRADGTVVPPSSDAVFPDTGGGGGGALCDLVTDFSDGANGALWKPQSEVTGRPVFLLGSEYWSGPKSVEDIQVLGSDDTVIASGSRRTCCPNGGRSHFDVSKSASALRPNAPITVRMRLSNGQYECRVVNDPTQRVD